jgi:hypothetical protein
MTGAGMSLGGAISKMSVARGGLGTDCGQGGLDQASDVSVALRIVYAKLGGGAIGLRSQFTLSQLGVKVAADELEERIGRIFVRQRAGNLKRLLVLLIVVVEKDG